MKISDWLFLFLLAVYCLPICVTASEAQAATSASNKQRFTSLIDRNAKRYGIEAALVHAVIKVGSNYNPRAVSRAGAIGLMQLMPETAAEYGVKSREALFDPEVNVKAGTRHLKRLLKKYKNISLALAAYNAGEESAVEFRKKGAYIETRNYVVSVIRYYQKYKKVGTPRGKGKNKVPHTVVAQVQKTLKAMGYYNSSVDGLTGPKTRAAIKAFQRDAGIPVNGVLDSKLVGQLELLDGLAKKKPSAPELASTGSGFVINQEGYVVTNHHVVDGCKEVKSPRLGSPGVQEVATNGAGRNSILGSVVATDQASDLAVVDFSGNYQYFARFKDDNKVKLGEPVVVAGFPLRGLLSDDLNVTTGEVSALSGIRDNAKLLQISAPVQTGNSGGPLLDQSGNVIGVVVAKLNALNIAKAIGDIPQNVNFAVKSAVARFLLDIHNVDYQTSDATERMGTAEIADQARNYTVVLECWK